MHNLPFADLNAIEGAWCLAPEHAARVTERGFAEYDALLAMPPEALAARLARPVNAPHGKLTRRGDVGVIEILDVLAKRDSWLGRLLGFTAYERIALDLQAALDDASLKSIALYIDSPGGEASGCDELAAAIYAARGKKPITAYVSGMACSAAYWIASAADKIVVSDLAAVGSIGVAMSVRDSSKRDAARGIVTKNYVSRQSPNKRPDINSPEGSAAIQKLVDDLGAVFVSAVAKHRKTTPANVIANFGQGGVKIGAHAAKCGMVDSVGQFEAVLASLSKNTGRDDRSDRVPARSVAIPEPTKVRAETVAERAARERIAAIIQSPEGQKNPTLAAHLANNTNKPPAVAIEDLRAARQAEIDASWKRVLDRQNNL